MESSTSTNTIPSTFTLNNGFQMPSMGLGTYSVDKLDQIVYQSIRDGLRLIDTASFYDNEIEVGKGINQAISENLIKREDLFVVTKIWYYQKGNPELALRKSLEKLNLDYVDLYLDHWPISEQIEDGISKSIPLHIFWKNMESLVKLGLTKSIGVSNYNVQLLNELLSFCEIKPVVNQVEFHPYLYQTKLKKYCMDNGIYLMAYNSLTRGAYINREKDFKNIDLIKEPIIEEMARKYGKTPGNIALNWSLSQDVIVIPATSNPMRMKENLESLSFRMTEEDVAKIGELNMNYRFIPEFSAFKEKNLSCPIFD